MHNILQYYKITILTYNLKTAYGLESLTYWQQTQGDSIYNIFNSQIWIKRLILFPILEEKTGINIYESSGIRTAMSGIRIGIEMAN